jgi:hypothetical protein
MPKKHGPLRFKHRDLLSQMIRKKCLGGSLRFIQALNLQFPHFAHIADKQKEGNYHIHCNQQIPTDSQKEHGPEGNFGRCRNAMQDRKDTEV